MNPDGVAIPCEVVATNISEANLSLVLKETSAAEALTAYDYVPKQYQLKYESKSG